MQSSTPATSETDANPHLLCLDDDILYSIMLLCDFATLVECKRTCTHLLPIARRVICHDEGWWNAKERDNKHAYHRALWRAERYFCMRLNGGSGVRAEICLTADNILPGEPAAAPFVAQSARYEDGRWVIRFVSDRETVARLTPDHPALATIAAYLPTPPVRIVGEETLPVVLRNQLFSVVSLASTAAARPRDPHRRVQWYQQYLHVEGFTMPRWTARGR